MTDRTLVAGIDSSTQSCKVVVRDAETGVLVREGRAAHPPGTEVPPAAWLAAMDDAIAQAGGLDDVAAVSVGAQQHGMVLLDEQGDVLRDALLWNDTRSAPEAAALVSDLGGPEPWAEAVGLVPLAAYTATKLRWVAEHEPDVADRIAAVCLPHDWLSWRLQADRTLETLATDRSDASGTAYYSAAEGRYRPDLLELALRGRTPRLPRVLGPHEAAGRTASGAAIGPGAGDNAAAALALDAGPGDLVVSLGTSGVVSVVSDTAMADPAGFVAGFADATGRQLPLVCTLNGAPVLAQIAGMLGVDLDELSRLALSAPPGAEGVVLVPWMAGERTPDLPTAQGSLQGLTTTNATPANIARAAVEGLLCSLVSGASHITSAGIAVERAMLVGGGARSAAVRALAPAIFGIDVEVPEPGEYVADGAARQAAWTLTDADAPPTWASRGGSVEHAELTPAVIERYVDVAWQSSLAFTN